MDIARHTNRPVRFMGLREDRGWRIKQHGISQDGQAPDQGCRDAAVEIAMATLPQPAVTSQRYGVAFVTVHQARLFNQIIVDWWERENELRHRVFKAAPESPYAFAEITPTGEAFCVWELRVLAHERQAWMDLVLRPEKGPNLDEYLEQVLNEDC